MSDDNPDTTDTTTEPTDSSATPTTGGLPAQTGPFILFRPDNATSTVALFAHGVDAAHEIDPIGGVTLGYYSPHGSSLDANITWAEGAPTYPPDGGPTAGKWPTYVLTTIGVGQPAELADTARAYGIAIAYVVDPTSTETVINQLVGLGLNDVRGVQCRAAVDADEDPTSFGTAVTKTQDELVSEGWKDAASEAVTATTGIAQGEYVTDANGAFFTVQAVDETVTPKSYTLAPYTG